MPAKGKNISCPIPASRSARWSEITTLGVGKASLDIFEPDDDIELKKLLLFLKENNLKFFLIGAGSNVVGTDKKIYDAAIRLAGKFFREISFGREHATVGAGVYLKDLATELAKKGFGGLSPLAGIPATVGGAIKMNAGCNGVNLGGFIEEICGLDINGNLWKASKKELSFSYRNSSVSDDKIILAAILRVPFSSPESEGKKIEDAIRGRAKHKFEGRNAGCAFLNPGSAKAGILLERAGCKGLSQGDAMISQIHANYFINKGACSENDFVRLLSKARKLVFENSGILLRPEVKFANPESLEKILSEPKPISVSVLKGGDSKEREISLISASCVASALRDAGMTVLEFDLKSAEIPDEVKKSNVIFPVLHGGFGENGEVQKKLEESGTRFVGSSSNSCAATIDKIKSKKIMLQNGIPTADFAVVTKKNLDSLAKIAESLAFPIVVKAPLEGSSFGITIVEKPEDLLPAVSQTFSFGENVLLENFIKGREITVGILHGQPLPVIEIEYPGKTYDFDAKYTHNIGETKYHCPPLHLSGDMQEKATEYAMAFFKAVDARDMLRVDFICTESTPYALEANSIPGFTESSLLPKAANRAGITFTELCAGLVSNVLKRK